MERGGASARICGLNKRRKRPEKKNLVLLAKERRCKTRKDGGVGGQGQENKRHKPMFPRTLRRAPNGGGERSRVFFPTVVGRRRVDDQFLAAKTEIETIMGDE